MQTKQHLKPDKDTLAVIYCRVSDRKQKTDGHGLESQEHRCRQYAEERGYSVEMVFTDDFTGGGDFMKRPAMRALLAYLAAESDQNYVIVFDDLKRLARDTKFHWTLREKLDAFGAVVESPNFKFDDTPEGRFVETMFAAQGQLEREQNSRQVVQKMTARVEKGYYVFHPPIGYRYEKDKAHGKILVRNEPVASIIAEALEGYANGTLGSQAEVKRFLESKPEFPKSGNSGYVHPSKVKDMLMKPVYAGYVEAPGWNVSLRKGHHEPLISFAVHQRIQEILGGAVYAPARKDINEDFPLRGFVLCDDCDQPMTSCWSKGRNKHYPYYLCDTPDCVSKRKSIRRADIEDGAEALLRNLQPATHILGLAKAMLIKGWNLRSSEAHRAKQALLEQIGALDAQIEKLLDRIVESGSSTVVKACEVRIEKLERQKIMLVEQVEQTEPLKGHHYDFIEPVFQFLANPCYLYTKGSIALKRTVLKLVFSEPLRYSRKEGYRTAKNTYPFKVLADISTPKCGMVGDPGIEFSMSWLLGYLFIFYREIC